MSGCSWEMIAMGGCISHFAARPSWPWEDIFQEHRQECCGRPARLLQRERNWVAVGSILGRISSSVFDLQVHEVHAVLYSVSENLVRPSILV